MKEKIYSIAQGKNTYQPMLYIFYTPPSFVLGGKESYSMLKIA
jgi:hypothetical protein